MATYEIECTVQYPSNLPNDHARIVEVGLRGHGRVKVDWVLSALTIAHVFITRDPRTGQRAQVRECTCNGTRHITTVGDGLVGNNLDALPRCR